MSSFKRVLLLLFVSTVALGMQTTTERANVRVVVTDNFGVQLDNAQVEFVSVGPQKRFSAIGPTADISNLPYGLYDAEITLKGFRTRRERLAVYVSRMTIRIGLELPPLHGEGRPTLTGHIRNTARLHLPWVRLIPVYGTNLLEADVEKGGQFQIVGLAAGEYVCVLFDGDRMVMSETVTFRGGKQSLDLFEAAPRAGSAMPKR